MDSKLETAEDTLATLTTEADARLDELRREEAELKQRLAAVHARIDERLQVRAQAERKLFNLRIAACQSAD